MSDIKIKVRMRRGKTNLVWNCTMEDKGDWVRFRRFLEAEAKARCPGNQEPEIRSVEVRFGPIERKGGK